MSLQQNTQKMVVPAFIHAKDCFYCGMKLVPMARKCLECGEFQPTKAQRDAILAKRQQDGLDTGIPKSQQDQAKDDGLPKMETKPVTDLADRPHARYYRVVEQFSMQLGAQFRTFRPKIETRPGSGRWTDTIIEDIPLISKMLEQGCAIEPIDGEVSSVGCPNCGHHFPVETAISSPKR